MHDQTDVLIIGGGLAGLTAALHLQKAGLEVIIIEKSAYPRHKVCGEYISNEVLPYLKWLDADPRILGATSISRLQFSTLSGKSIYTALPLGGFGISRFCLDHFLAELFKSRGGIMIQDTVTKTSLVDPHFDVCTQGGKNFHASQVIGAYGKRSAMDLKLKRSFIQKKSPYLAVKAHYSGNFPDDLVGLHNFRGGYCGVSKVEGQKINICYLTDYESFKAHKDIETFQRQVLYKNIYIRAILQETHPLFEPPVSISQLAFGAREAVAAHVMMIGDTAALIHPLCGNGMGMAIHSAKICAELLISFFDERISSRAVLEKMYISAWDKQFRSRLRMGSVLSSALRKERLAEVLLEGMIRMPPLLPMLIRRTHGKMIMVNQ